MKRSSKYELASFVTLGLGAICQYFLDTGLLYSIIVALYWRIGVFVYNRMERLEHGTINMHK